MSLRNEEEVVESEGTTVKGGDDETVKGHGTALQNRNSLKDPGNSHYVIIKSVWGS